MNIKLKNKILIAGFIGALFIVYKLAITKTYNTRKEVKELKVEKELLGNVSEKMLNLKKKERQIDDTLKKNNISIKNSFQQTLLQILTSFSKTHNLQLLAFNEPHVYNTDLAKKLTFSFEIRGDYISLIKMINHLENLQLGELISVNFEKKINFKTRKKYLTCKVLLQRVSS